MKGPGRQLVVPKQDQSADGSHVSVLPNTLQDEPWLKNAPTPGLPAITNNTNTTDPTTQPQSTTTDSVTQPRSTTTESVTQPQLVTTESVTQPHLFTTTTKPSKNESDNQEEDENDPQEFLKETTVGKEETDGPEELSGERSSEGVSKQGKSNETMEIPMNESVATESNLG